MYSIFIAASQSIDNIIHLAARSANLLSFLFLFTSERVARDKNKNHIL